MENKTTKFYLFVAILVLLIMLGCKEDDFYTAHPQHQQTTEEINIRTISLEEFNQKLNAMDNKSAIERYMSSSLSGMVQRGLNLTDYVIQTDEIKEIKRGDYTSYTMYLRTPDSEPRNLYNITVEEKAGKVLLFVTLYEATNNWIENPQQRFEGTISTYRLASLTMYEDLPSFFDDIIGGTASGIDTGGGGTGAAGPGTTSYPYDCDGYVEMTIVIEDIPCGCGHILGSSPPCSGSSCGPPMYPSQKITNLYTCIPYGFPADPEPPQNPNDPNPGGGGGNPSNLTNSITTPVGLIKEENPCNPKPVGDLNKDCAVDYHAQQFLNFYNNRTEEQQGVVDVNLMEFFIYLSDNDFNEASKASVEDFFEIKEEVSDAKAERYFELVQLIKTNPWVLIENCVQQNGMNTADYIDLYNHTMPQSCKDRLNSLGLFGIGYNDQPISAGNVPCANIDYYGIEITTKPDFNNDGQPDTNAQIYQAFRNNFTNLASGQKDNFQFSCDTDFDGNIDANDTGDISWEFVPYSPNDANLFTSSNPITAILNIEASASGIGDLVADDGAIMVSGFTANYWTISTIETPYNGTQPFSGNRQWGWNINQNGNFEFFTRAVDVANISILVNILSPADTECQQDTYYNIAEATWQNLQQEIADWVNNSGGQATINTPKAVRVDKDKIIEILTTNNSIDQILSNCN